MKKNKINDPLARIKSGKKSITKLFLVTVFILLLNSCIGVSLDIQMNSNGSGRLTLQYRISRLLDNIGTLDGNESMPPIPAGRTDWERTVQRIEGASLVSHSRRETAQDVLINVTLDFTNVQALTEILSFSGVGVSVNNNRDSGNFDFIIFNGSTEEKYDENLMALMRSVFSDYNFSVTFNAPRNSTLTFTDGQGNARLAPSSAAVTNSGRRVSASVNIIDAIEMTGGLGVKINW